jgi:molybdopterin-guanine dinucleotide biosynthesis adapter protein
MMPLLVVTGESGSGKTTLIEKIVRELVSRRYKVGVIKHSPDHPGLEEAGKDTWKYSRAGAEVICLATDQQLFIIKKSHRHQMPEELLQNFEGMDLVLAEGYKKQREAQTPVLEIVKEGQKERYSKNPLALVKTCCSQGLAAGTEDTQCFHRDNIDGICGLIEKKLLTKEETP